MATAAVAGPAETRARLFAWRTKLAAAQYCGLGRRPAFGGAARRNEAGAAESPGAEVRLRRLAIRFSRKKCFWKNGGVLEFFSSLFVIVERLGKKTGRFVANSEKSRFQIFSRASL